MKHLNYKNDDIDTIDEKILNTLSNNARISNVVLARLVGLSPPSVAERIKKLEDAGVIEGYTVKINPDALGLPIRAWLRIRPVPGQLQKVLKILQEQPEIIECDRVTGDDCFVARAQLQSVDHLEKLIDKVIPYSMTNTSIIQSSPVTRRLPPISSSK